MNHTQYYLNVQQDPQWPWFLTGLTIPVSLQSFCNTPEQKLKTINKWNDYFDQLSASIIKDCHTSFISNFTAKGIKWSVLLSICIILNPDVHKSCTSKPKTNQSDLRKAYASCCSISKLQRSMHRKREHSPIWKICYSVLNYNQNLCNNRFIV